MTFESALRNHLGGASGITSLVGDRITPIVRQETKTVPAMTYAVISIDDQPSLSGSSGGAVGALEHIRLQIDGFAGTHSDMIALRAATRLKMAEAASQFRAVLLPGGFEQYEPDTKLYRFMLEFSVWYSPT